MKIALINPPYLLIYRKLNIKQDASIPLGLLYVAASLERERHEVRIFDPNLTNMSLPELTESVRSFHPGLIGLTTVTPTFNSVQKLSGELKKAIPEATIVMGGPHVSALPEQSLACTPGVDYVVVGEGELTIIELVKEIEHKTKSLSAIEGICYRNDGKVVCNPPCKPIENLDSLPYPSYHLLPILDYSPSVIFRIKRKSTFIISSRGCPAACTFCANNVTGRRLRVHSIDYFLGLVKYLIEKYGICHFHIVDDNFLSDKERAREICRRIIDDKLNITWFIFARTDHCQEVALLRLMKKAGVCLYSIWN